MSEPDLGFGTATAEITGFVYLPETCLILLGSLKPADFCCHTFQQDFRGARAFGLIDSSTFANH